MERSSAGKGPSSGNSPGLCYAKTGVPRPRGGGRAPGGDRKASLTGMVSGLHASVQPGACELPSLTAKEAVSKGQEMPLNWPVPSTGVCPQPRNQGASDGQCCFVWRGQLTSTQHPCPQERARPQLRAWSVAGGKGKSGVCWLPPLGTPEQRLPPCQCVFGTVEFSCILRFAWSLPGQSRRPQLSWDLGDRRWQG